MNLQLLQIPFIVLRYWLTIIFPYLMKIITKIFMLPIFLLLLANTAADSFAKSSRDKTAVQSDHFFSESEISTSHQLTNVEEGKPMLLLLKKKSSRKTDPLTNHITVAFSWQNQTHSCILKSFNHLCVIEEVLQANITLRLQCAKAPCDISWVIYQPEISTVNAGQLGEGLFTLQQSSDHMVAFITCNDPEIKHFSEDVSVYASSPFEKGGSGNQLHYLFANEQKGFLYIDVKEQSRKCTHISIADVPKKIEYSGRMIRDFTKKDSPSAIRLNMPTSDFRLDCMLSKLDESSVKTESTVTLRGTNENTTSILETFSIGPLKKQKSIEFSITFKKPVADYDYLQLQLLGRDDTMTMLGMVISEEARQEVDISQRNYFHLKKGQKISYKLLPDEQAQQKDQVYFIPKHPDSLDLTQTNCSAKKGCTFQITAIQEITSYLHFSSTAPDAQQAIEYVPLDKKIKRKIKQGENIYFHKSVKAKKVFQIVVNNPNVILYGSMKEKCEFPDAKCLERSGNSLHPFAYDPKTDGEFIIAVLGLQNGEFTLSVIEEEDEHINLEDGVAFTYRVEQDEEQILFKYKLQKQLEVSFNLVAPLNHLTLQVSNGKEESQQLTFTSSQGYVIFEKKQLKGLEFAISVRKTDLSKNKMTHFTLIASSSNAVLRLQPTLAHYETLQPQIQREYIFEFDPAEDYILNFYTHNFKSNQLQIMLALSSDRVWGSNNLDMLWIDRPSDFLDLRIVASALCAKTGEDSCEIFMMLKNQMEVQVDVTITLMMRNAVIELKDGIWQSYQEGTIASDAKFYFQPKHIDKNVVLLYSTPMEDLRISYSLWKADSKNLNPTQWPFPRPKDTENGASIRTVNHVTIDKQLLKSECWPNCIVLVTLYRDRTIPSPSHPVNAEFQIMASNSQIELPEKTRVNMVLRKGEERELIVDLKYSLEKKYINFYTSHSIGNFDLSANLASQKQARCPEETQDTDMGIQQGETVIDMAKLRERMKELGMEGDRNVYLCVLARGIEDSKFSIEYVTDRTEVRLLHPNSFQQVKLTDNQTKIYQMPGFFNFVVKIIRTSGYPYLVTKKCDMDSLKQCQDQFIASQQWGKQIVKKTEQFSEDPCPNCVHLFKFHGMEPCAAMVHLNSLNSETELKEHEIISDFVEGGEQSRYSITHVLREDLTVNVHAVEGDVEVTFSNYEQVSLLKSTESGKKTVHFFLPKSYSFPSQPALHSDNSAASFGAFEYSNTFGSFHMTVGSRNPNATATFSISYSSGENQVRLQDGLITDIVLEPNLRYNFIYENERSSSHIYLILSAKEENVLSSISIASFFIDCEGEQQNRTEFKLEVPKVRRRTPNPTYLLSLPQKNYFEIELVNPTPKAEIVSLSINHQQLVVLPFDHEFPFTLHPREDINFLTEINSPGFVHVQIRKCDQSSPIFSYSFDYDQFVSSDFEIQKELTEQARFEESIRVAKAGSFYINIKTLQEATILAISLKFSANKSEKAVVKAGGKGRLQYELIEAKKATLHFSPVVCGDAEDCLGITYYSMSSTNIADLYAQLVCPSSFFSIQSMRTAQTIALKPIKHSQSTGNITFTQELSHHSLFVAVKAATGSGEEIYYHPVEIITIWGHLSKTSQSYRLTFSCIILASICALLLFVRHNARRGYRRIQEGEAGRE